MRTIMRTIEQKRALFAYQKVNKINSNPANDDKKKKEFRSKILKYPAMVQACGLLQSVAFYSSKKDVEKEVNRILLDWLRSSQQDLAFPNIGEINEEGFTSYLANLELELYRNITREALAFLTWLKRAAEAILPEE